MKRSAVHKLKARNKKIPLLILNAPLSSVQRFMVTDYVMHHSLQQTQVFHLRMSTVCGQEWIECAIKGIDDFSRLRKDHHHHCWLCTCPWLWVSSGRHTHSALLLAKLTFAPHHNCLSLEAGGGNVLGNELCLMKGFYSSLFFVFMSRLVWDSIDQSKFRARVREEVVIKPQSRKRKIYIWSKYYFYWFLPSGSFDYLNLTVSRLEMAIKKEREGILDWGSSFDSFL